MSKNNYYEPELGQFLFGQPWQKLECPKLLEAALVMIDNELDRIMWNINQEAYSSPFENTGTSFKCYNIFEVKAYNWGDKAQDYNFKWKDIEVSWYKYLGRGMSVNREVSNGEIENLLGDCLNALIRYEKEFDEDFSIF